MSPASVILVLLIAVGPAVLRAGVRSSADYSVSAETLDSAGEVALSPDYRNQPSLGGSGGTSAAGSAIVQAGYIMQLAPATALELTSPTVAVLETASLRLSAWEILSDGTRAALSGSEVAWTVGSGPLTALGGGVFAGKPVYQDSAAVAGAASGGLRATLPLAVLNSIADNFGSYTGDGLPDDWQVRYFGPDNPAAAPGADPDGDGMDNAFEWAAQLDPTDSASRFDLTITAIPGQPSQRRITFSPRFEGPGYTLETSTDLVAWSPLAASTVADAGTVRSVTDLAAAGPAKFYRVRISGAGGEFSYANDGIPDDWQIEHFGVANPAAAPAADPDGDGHDNAFEFAADLDPTDPASRFNITIATVAGQPGQRRITFSPRFEGIGYTLETSTNLVGWSPLASFAVSDAGTVRTVTDLAAGTTLRWYRVAITRP